jgi:hypothetical protein
MRNTMFSFRRGALLAGIPTVLAMLTLSAELFGKVCRLNHDGILRFHNVSSRQRLRSWRGIGWVQQRPPHVCGKFEYLIAAWHPG